MEWTLLELQAETGIEKRTTHTILREDLHLQKIASKWMTHALSEVEKWTRYAICHLLIFIYLFIYFKIRIIHTSKST